MPVLKSIRFQKNDTYDNSIFIANQTEKENFNDLKDTALKLQAKNLGTFLPIYHSEEHNYTTLRFMKSNFVYPEPDCVYSISYKIKIKTKENKSYVNCFINKLTFVKKIKRDDEGDELEL